MIATDALAGALITYLPRQRWFGGDASAAEQLRVASVETLRKEWPALVQALVDVPDGDTTATYQVMVGLRPLDTRDTFLEGKPDAVLGELESDLGPAFAYDALVDPELSLCILEHAAPDMGAERARLLGADQSNTSVVFDERLIMKLFRRVADGPNPDVEVTRALATSGFGSVPAPVGEWRRGDAHLAVVTEFLVGGVDGFHLALTSIRDLYDAKCEPQQAGGDFGPDARRLGAITAQMHVALASAFGSEPGSGAAWAGDMEAHLARVDLADVDPKAVAAAYGRLREIDVGPAIRVHGDHHLGQVMRTDAGWHVLDFEGEPARPLDERRRPSSALRDVAGMLRSFHYAAEVGLREYGDAADEELRALAQAWERHVSERFLEGYRSVDEADSVLPPTERCRTQVLTAFLLDKAVYEVGYEASHRPEWVGIPLFAVRRILEETGT